MVVATALMAAIGDINPFGSPQKLVSSGSGPSYYGRIRAQGPGRARGPLVEAAWGAARALGPLRASRRGQHICGRRPRTRPTRQRL